MKIQNIFLMTIISLIFFQFGIEPKCQAEIISKIITTMDDVFVYKADPDENYNDGAPSCPNCGNALKLIPPEGFEDEARILLKYLWDEIPSDVTISSAELHFIDSGSSVNNSSDSEVKGVKSALDSCPLNK